ncbi:MAG: gamma-glutamyl-gamma-aminobutyrate hydrolase, partial [Alphaproteobacteria bacterium HGW-Alphaproteobacteria-2]
HPEWNAPNDPVSCALFAAFGKAVADWAAGARPGARRRA